MKQSIKRALTKDIGLKILALVFSFFLWLTVVNVDDPKQTRTFTAVVTVTNEDVLTRAGKLYEIKDGINTVSFRVTAKRSIIEKLSSADFTATADMNYLESGERVPVNITANNYASYISISSKQNYLYVQLEDEVTERFMIEPATTGETEAGITIESVSCSPTVITITGREDKVSTIHSVMATCDITGLTEDITESVIPKLYDEEGNLIDSTGLTLSISTVDVSVDITNVKSVDILVKTSGILPEYLTLGSITTDPSSVLVQGEIADLNEITEITIPDTVVNLSNVVGSFSTTVDISAYLPTGVTLADKSKSKVKIYVNMVGDQTKEVTIPAKNITFANLDEGLAATLDSDTITTNIFGDASIVGQYDGSTLSGFIDCTGLTVGEKQNVVLQFESVENLTIQNVTVTITIVSDNSATTEETSTEDTSAETAPEHASHADTNGEAADTTENTTESNEGQ